jgi:hypothetical protein
VIGGLWSKVIDSAPVDAAGKPVITATRVDDVVRQHEEEQRRIQECAEAEARAAGDVADALEIHCPDPDRPHREWRQNFHKALSGVYKPTQFTPEAVAEKADDTCLDSLRRAAETLVKFHDDVRAAVAERTPDNVRELRRVV